MSALEDGNLTDLIKTLTLAAIILLVVGLTLFLLASKIIWPYINERLLFDWEQKAIFWREPDATATLEQPIIAPTMQIPTKTVYENTGDSNNSTYTVKNTEDIKEVR